MSLYALESRTKPSQQIEDSWSELAPNLGQQPPAFCGEVLDGMAESGFTVDVADSLGELERYPSYASRMFQRPQGRHMGVTQRVVAATPEAALQGAATKLAELANSTAVDAPELAAVWRAITSLSGVKSSRKLPTIRSYSYTPGVACPTADDKFFGALLAHLEGDQSAMTFYRADDEARTPVIAQKSSRYGEQTGIVLRSLIAHSSESDLEIPPGSIVGMDVPGLHIVRNATEPLSVVAGIKFLRMSDLALPPDAREGGGEYYALGRLSMSEITEHVTQRLGRSGLQ